MSTDASQPVFTAPSGATIEEVPADAAAAPAPADPNAAAPPAAPADPPSDAEIKAQQDEQAYQQKVDAAKNNDFVQQCKNPLSRVDAFLFCDALVIGNRVYDLYDDLPLCDLFPNQDPDNVFFSMFNMSVASHVNVLDWYERIDQLAEAPPLYLIVGDDPHKLTLVSGKGYYRSLNDESRKLLAVDIVKQYQAVVQKQQDDQKAAADAAAAQPAVPAADPSAPAPVDPAVAAAPADPAAAAPPAQ